VPQTDGPVIRFADVEVKKLSTALADSITDTILRNGLQPGARLPSEREMREQFGVGRGTLREALRVLEAEGLITVRSGPNGGPVIAKPDAIRLTRLLILLLLAWGATLRSVYEVRIVLEPLTAARAAACATPEQVAELRASVAALTEVVDDEAAVVQENQRFHRQLAEASGNPVLVAFSLALLAIFDGYEMGTHYPLETRRDIVAIHTTIVDAIAAGNSDASRRASLAHVKGTVQFLQENYPEVLDEPLRPHLVTHAQESFARPAS
jgi:DNA-binding FadR family transcriptional regulator